jgi:hypothetical protein
VSAAHSDWTTPPGSEAAPIFPAIVLPLFLFVDRLSRRLSAEGYSTVYFLAREGQLLQRLFEIHAAVTGTRGLETRYLHISRRAAFGASLRSLDEETFAPLFDQYFAVSAADFLSSLGLNAGEQIATTGAAGVQLDRIEADWPKSAAWRALRASPVFARIYERNRQMRRHAFDAYARTIGLQLQDRAAVVDVGWRGSIQDYLSALLAPKHGLDGYYLGLLPDTQTHAHNRKHGLLFSPATRHRPLGRAINESRALFELLLAANHGAVTGYTVEQSGAGSPVFDPLDADWQGLRETYGPVRARIERDFQQLCKTLPPQGRSDDEIEHAVARQCAQMMLRPSDQEIEWFARAEHRENFGVFRMTRFSRPGRRDTLSGRLALGAELVTAPRHAIGATYWPVFTLREHGLTRLERAYVRLRERQLGFSTEVPCAFVL